MCFLWACAGIATDPVSSFNENCATTNGIMATPWLAATFRNDWLHFASLMNSKYHPPAFVQLSSIGQILDQVDAFDLNLARKLQGVTQRVRRTQPMILVLECFDSGGMLPFDPRCACPFCRAWAAGPRLESPLVARSGIAASSVQAHEVEVLCTTLFLF